MAFLDETGLKTFKSKCDSAYAAKNHTHNYAATNHNHDSTYLKLSGGTMTGMLVISDSNLTMKDPYIDRTTNATTNQYISFTTVDKSGQRVGVFETSQSKGTRNYTTTIGASVRSTDNTTYYNTTIGCTSSYDGSVRTYSVSHPAAFRNAIRITSGSSAAPSSDSSGAIYIQV